MRSFWIYIIGAILAIGGIAYALYAMDVLPIWIGVVVLVIGGIAIASGAGLSKKKSSETTNVNVESSRGEDNVRQDNPPR